MTDSWPLLIGGAPLQPEDLVLLTADDDLGP